VVAFLKTFAPVGIGPKEITRSIMWARVKVSGEKSL
jgi:hypothetical protein